MALREAEAARQGHGGIANVVVRKVLEEEVAAVGDREADDGCGCWCKYGEGGRRGGWSDWRRAEDMEVVFRSG